MKEYAKYIGYIIGIYLVIWFLTKFMRKQKMLAFLHELGFYIADRMEADEVKTSYIYLHDYARKYGANASQILRGENPDLWNKAKIISDKYKIFNL